jgi:hypothetical protein
MSTESTVSGDLDALAATLVVSQKETQPSPVEDDEDELQATSGDADEAPEEDVAETDDAEPEEAPQEEPAEGLYTVKVDGQERQVTLDELRRSYSGQAYIQERMQQVAEARKAFETEVATVRQAQAVLADMIGRYQQAMAERGAPAKPPLELLDVDPIRYHREMALHNEWAQEQAYHEHQRQTLLQQQAQAEEAERRQRLEWGQSILRERIPEFADPQRAPALKRELFETGQAYGFSPEELASIDDPRMVLALNELRKARAVQARKPQALEKVAQARPMLKPGATKGPEAAKRTEAEKARARMKRTGDVDDVVKFLLS